jgi:hypothetical protein
MGSLFPHESRINMQEESLEHSFKTQEFLGRGRGKGNKGRGQRGSHQTEGRTTPE